MEDKELLQHIADMPLLTVSERLTVGVCRFLNSDLSDESFKEHLELPCFIGMMKSVNKSESPDKIIEDFNEWKDVKSLMKELNELKTKAK